MIRIQKTKDCPRFNNLFGRILHAPCRHVHGLARMLLVPSLALAAAGCCTTAPAKTDKPEHSIDHVYFTKGIHALRHEIGVYQEVLDITDHSPVLVEFTLGK